LLKIRECARKKTVKKPKDFFRAHSSRAKKI